MKVLFIVIGIIILITAIIALRVFFGLGHPGNAAPYALRRQLPRDNSPLRGKTILCLGSSISSGFSSGGVSFLDYLARIDGCRIIQETVSATTLADRGYFSYLKRLRRRMARMPQAPDCFLCQLSTNDATFRSVPGRVSRSFRADDFDASTTVGGMEAILAMVREKWDCPIVFYTAARYDNPRYHKLVNLLVDLQEKWDFALLDLWHDTAFNALSPEERALYMNDAIHPTRAGYLLRAVGDNEVLVTSLAKDKGMVKILGLALANGFVALAGCVYCQQKGFFEVSTGTGTMVIGLASVIIGTKLLKRFHGVKATTAVIFGSIVYKACVSLAIALGMAASDLKLITAVLFLIILVASNRKERKVKAHA